MIAVGLDGYARGWVAVTLEEGAAAIRFLPSIDELAASPHSCVAIDIPIGLPDFGSDNHRRACDAAARERLRPHTSRVFTGAARGLWDFASAADANTALRARGLPGISLQLWHLGAKIMEVDAFVGRDHSFDLREAHPELVFHRLNGERPLPSKKTRDGAAFRRHLLERNGFTRSTLDFWLTRRIGTGAKADDVLDACACAIAARDFACGFCVPAGEAPRDARRLPMQIWY